MKFVVLIEINSGHAQVLSALAQASKSAKGRRLGESDHRTGFRTSLFSKKTRLKSREFELLKNCIRKMSHERLGWGP